jgi:trehalose synthase
MISKITYPVTSVDKYLALIPPEIAEQLLQLAKDLRHLRFVHINSTAVGGGVAEILQSLVPFMNSLGVVTERVVINPSPKFFHTTKRIHNLLQGAAGALSPKEMALYLQSIKEVAKEMRSRRLSADIWFLHDPQLLPLAQMLAKEFGETRFWVCHIDLTAPNPQVLDSLLPLAKSYEGMLVSLPSYMPNERGLNTPVYVVPPAIDPLSIKNVPLNDAEALRIVAEMGVDPTRPLISQVSRFDRWKDPWGVIDAFRIAREALPGLQLALLGLSQAMDDPEALDVLASVTSYVAEDPDIHLYFDPTGLSESIDNTVNAFQMASGVVIQKSTREGFGLTVTEAMWKAKVVIGGNVGGIRAQIDNGVTGWLVDSSTECAQRVIQTMENPSLRIRMGQAARESVRRSYLLPRLAVDYLRLAKSHVPKAG